jgi:hypothetical protein
MFIHIKSLVNKLYPAKFECNCYALLKFAVLLVMMCLATTPVFSQKNNSRGLRLDGKQDYVDFGNRYQDLKLPFTISAWINIDRSNFYLAPVFSSRNCFSNYSGFSLVVDKNYIHIQYGDGFGAKHHAFRKGMEVSVDLPADEWHHVTAVVKDHATMELYLDGIKIEGEMTGTSGHGMDSSSPEGFTSAGYFISNDVKYFYKGAIDDIRLWNRALSQDEISRSVCNTLTGNEAGLIGYWTFDENSGKVCYDKSSNKFHGTLVGNPQREPTTPPSTENCR